MTDQIFYTEGAGNTFFFTLSEKLGFEDLLKESLNRGLEPDGFIVSKLIEDDLLSFNFYNKDGSNVDFCGNALRAVGLCYGKISGINTFRLKTKVGDLKILVKNQSLVEAQMPWPEDKGFVKIDGKEIPHILSGVPHLVFERSLFGLHDDEDLEGFCKRIRASELNGAEAYNLTLYKKDTDPIQCVTFERGVEGFTQACGSGALSVAKVVGGEEVNLKMPGGLLKIQQKNEEIFMLGPAKIIEIY